MAPKESFCQATPPLRYWEMLKTSALSTDSESKRESKRERERERERVRETDRQTDRQTEVKKIDLNKIIITENK
jgi:hypothetical protein